VTYPSTTPALATPVAGARDLAGPAALVSLWHVAQLAVAAAVVYLYDVEGPAFLRVFLLAGAGFVANLMLPLAARLPFFVALSWVGAWLTFGPADALWLVAVGGALIGVCHLPVRLAVRCGLLLGAAAALAAARATLFTAPWSLFVWPILGSMFMFRLALYLHTLETTSMPRHPWSTLAYFFMLPNLVFPLFPVVDYQTFRRTHYDKPAAEIHEQGLLWISRGVVHLLLYRFVYQNVLNDPIDVVQLSGVVQFMVGTFLLYLRVSGQFHMIVGLLHLFGFRLPETHKLYYLAHSFTELWRRINIYWTDFMMKTVFYPVYFKVKRLGPAAALILSTVAVFVVTWVLHSYQWFWLRGGFPLTLQDTLFWGLLGALVVRGAVKELSAPKKIQKRVTGWQWRLGLQSMTTFAVFCLLWSLWSTDSVGEWIWMIAAAANIDAAGIALAALILGTVFLLGGRDWAGARSGPGWLRLLSNPATRTLVPLVLLLVAAQPAVQAALPDWAGTGLRSLHEAGLNARDAALQNRGYYEQLDVRGQLNERVIDALDSRSANWAPLASTGILHERRTDMLTRDLYPSKSVVWNGKQVTTNQWGMRDQEYDRAKAPGTFRIGIVGPSLVMGSGIADGETFEALIEARLNRAKPLPGYDRYEILNFGVEGHALPEQVAMLEDRVFTFQPDLAIAVLYHPTRWWTERYVRKVVWDRVDIPHPELRALLTRAGLGGLDNGPGIPFPLARRIAAMVGIQSRMPTSESAARIRWITDEFVDLSILHYAQVTREHEVPAVLLALNAVIDDVPKELPHLAAIRQSGLPVIDLFHVYPEDQKAELRVAPWDEHPNARGHQMIADRLYDALVQQMASAANHVGK